MSYVNICVARGCNAIHNAPKRCHLNSGSHSSGLEHSEHIWKVVFPVAEHGRLTQLLGSCLKLENPCKSKFSWFFRIFLNFGHFGQKCSKMPGKVVLAGGRDPKSAIRAHLVAEKLSLASYFCPQTCSEPEWTPIFPGRDPGRGPSTTCWTDTTTSPHPSTK